MSPDVDLIFSISFQNLSFSNTNLTSSLVFTINLPFSNSLRLSSSLNCLLLFYESLQVNSMKTLGLTLQTQFIWNVHDLPMHFVVLNRRNNVYEALL